MQPPQCRWLPLPGIVYTAAPCAKFSSAQLRPGTTEEVTPARAYVRKVSGASKPSRSNEAAFRRAVDEVAGATARLLEAMVTSAPPRNREAEAAKARARSAQRFGRATAAQAAPGQ